MSHLKRAITSIRCALLLGVVAACADQPVTPSASAGDASAPALSAGGRAPRDVPEVRIDLPPAPRAWDRDPAALARAVETGGGYAIVAFKEPGSARALATGRRGAVTAGTVRAGLQLLEREGAEVVELLENIGAARVRIAPGMAAEIAAHPLVDYVEPRQYGRIAAQTTPWGITMTGAPTVWPTNTGSGSKVLIIDTGHQQNHADLPAVPSANCAGVYGGCDDGGVWHGTHVLGIVAARNNTAGVVGVAPGIANANVYMYGACDSASGYCVLDEVTAGINAGIWNVDVMNLSLSGPYDAAQASAVAQAWNSGIVIVAAAGNNLSNTPVYPAAYANVIGVSGVRSDKSFASSSTACPGAYSNYGSHVDLSAPFEAYSTIGVNTYGTLCGTSMAAPHVTGAVALVRTQNPTWTNQQIVSHLFATAEDRGTVGRDDYYGHGIVKVAASSVPPVAVSITSGPSTITTAGSYTWTASASGGSGTYTYGWEYRVAGGTWSAAGTGSSHTRGVAAGNASFELRVTATSGGQTATATRSVTVNITSTQLPTVVISGPTDMVPGQPGTWNAVVTNATGTVTYQWQYRTGTSTTWTNVGTGGSSYSRSAPLRSFYLRVNITAGNGSATDDHSVYVEPIDDCDPICS